MSVLLEEIKLGESNVIEFKREIPTKAEKYIKTVVAFANTSGGKIIIGVDDKTNQIVGIDKSKISKIKDDIANAISDSCSPQIFPNIYVQTINDKILIIIEIYPGSQRPYYIKSLGKENGTFIRVSGTSRPADFAIIKDLEFQGVNLSFDETICLKQNYDEEKANELCTAIKNHILATIKTEDEKQNVKDITVQNLINWGVVKSVEGKLTATNAFVLLTNNIFPFAKIQCALFKGNDRVIFLDKREFSGPLYKQIEEAYLFVLKHINLGAEINGLYRTDLYELPPNALREAIVNAVTHRNYLEPSCVQVAIYDNRVEITSPGMLYGGLTIEQIKGGGSKIRNHCIAGVFSRMNIIEGWGTGIKRMIAACKEYGVQEPEFIEFGDSLRVNFYKNVKISSNESIFENDRVNDRVNDSVNDSVNLSNTEKIVYYAISQNPSITIEELVLHTKFSSATINRALKSLKTKEKIKRNGSDKKGFWEIIEK